MWEGYGCYSEGLRVGAQQNQKQDRPSFRQLRTKDVKGHWEVLFSSKSVEVFGWLPSESQHLCTQAAGHALC